MNKKRKVAKKKHGKNRKKTVISLRHR